MEAKVILEIGLKIVSMENYSLYTKYVFNLLLIEKEIPNSNSIKNTMDKLIRTNYFNEKEKDVFILLYIKVLVQNKEYKEALALLETLYKDDCDPEIISLLIICNYELRECDTALSLISILENKVFDYDKKISNAKLIKNKIYLLLNKITIDEFKSNMCSLLKECIETQDFWTAKESFRQIEKNDQCYTEALKDYIKVLYSKKEYCETLVYIFELIELENIKIGNIDNEIMNIYENTKKFIKKL